MEGEVAIPLVAIMERGVESIEGGIASPLIALWKEGLKSYRGRDRKCIGCNHGGRRRKSHSWLQIHWFHSFRD